MEPDKDPEVKKKNPRTAANFFSVSTFAWTIPTFIHGFKKEFTAGDLTESLQEHMSANIGSELERYWIAEVESCKITGREPGLLRPLIKMFGWDMLHYLLVTFISQCIWLLQPIFLGGLLAYFTPGIHIHKNAAYIYAFGIIMCSAIVVFTYHSFLHAYTHMGMKIRIATCSLMYRKVLQLDKMTLGQTSVGQLVNLMSNDVNRFDVGLMYLPYLFIGPIQALIVVYVLWYYIGISSVISIVALLLITPIQGWFGKQSFSLRLKTALRTDNRMNLMSEIISGIQIVKLYTWEKPFEHLIALARQKEIATIKKAFLIKAMIPTFALFHSRIGMFVAIICYILQGGNLTAKTVFVLSSYLNNILKNNLVIYLPVCIIHWTEIFITINRIKNFMLIKTCSAPCVKNENGMTFDKGPKKTKMFSHNVINTGSPSIILKKVCANWTEGSSNDTLTDISLELMPNKLTAIIGTVGSGKTSLLQVLLKELPISDGEIRIFGKLSYAAQEPWLFQKSVRQNILFGEPYIKEKYEEVVKVCALIADFEQLPFGDKTTVGERGTTLSGGQKARINLARAVYREADIYLLDDPLSAVDTHVGKHLFEKCIQGYLKGKSIILITQQLQYLEAVDEIILLEDGKLLMKGTYTEMQNAGLNFAKLLTTEEKIVDELTYSNIRSFDKIQSSSQQTINIHTDESIKITQSPDVVNEKQRLGSISGKVFASYFKHGGGYHITFIIFLLFMLTQAFAGASDYWLSYWVDLEENGYGNKEAESNFIPRNGCLYIYLSMILVTAFFCLSRIFVFGNMCMTSSIKLHSKMFDSIIKTSIWFFNNNPPGRILNRFSKDIGVIDELIPPVLVDVIQIAFVALVVVIIVSIVNPWLLIPIALSGVICYYLYKIYIKTSRSLKRLEGIARSPVYTHLYASLQGLSTIRASNIQDKLINEFDKHQDQHTSAYYLFFSLSRAFGFWVDLICFIFISLTTISFLILEIDVSASYVGLAIYQSIFLSDMLQWGIRQYGELENYMTSMERILEYSSLDNEDTFGPGKTLNLSWPEKGKIIFKHVFLRYSPTKPWVLKDLNFTIEDKEKVGIVGRTGAGKSSLISALFRLSEIAGLIEIDGVNTSDIGLHELRSKISIIPQDPVLFSGTIRRNLDPFDEHHDTALWNAIDQVELRGLLQVLGNGLQSKISEGGSNLSVGQRQLLCLARAALRNNKIIFLDEPTANLDPKTDSLIQKTVRSIFATCTVITIAHRLNTVMDSDKILVMDDGSAVEFDHPYLLLQNTNGYFYRMVENTGRTMKERLYKIAQESYNCRRK